MRRIALLLVLCGLAACQTTLDPQTSRAVAFAAVTEGGIRVETMAGNSHIFTRTEVCQGQTWMMIGPERFTLRQIGTQVTVDGVPIDGLRCPPQNDGGRNNDQPRVTPDETRERSGEMRPRETRGEEGTTDDGEGVGFGAISG